MALLLKSSLSNNKTLFISKYLHLLGLQATQLMSREAAFTRNRQERNQPLFIHACFIVPMAEATILKMFYKNSLFLVNSQ